MWDFLSSVLEQAGLVALLYVLTLLGGGFAFRALWKAHRDTLDKLAEVQKAEAQKRLELHKGFETERADLRRQHAAAVAELRKDYEAEVRQLLDQRKADAAEYAGRLDELHERRVAEMRDVTAKAVQHIASIDQTVGKLGTAVDVLVRITDAGR